MSRPIVLPEFPPDYRDASEGEWLAYARAAVEADRRSIVVTSEDVEAAMGAYPTASYSLAMRAALESYAARLRGTP